MCAVENAHFAGAEWRHVLGPDHIESGLVKWQFLGKFRRPLNHPQMKNFSRVDKAIGIAKFRSEAFRFGLRVARHNPVNQSAQEGVCLPHPSNEGLPEIPGFCVTQHILPEFLPVSVNQFARQKNQPLCSITPHRLEALVKQCRDFGGKRIGTDSRLERLRNPRNSGFSCV